MAEQRRRKLNLLLQPALQLKLPVFLLLITIGFAAFQVIHGYIAYNQLFGTVLKEAGQPPMLQELLRGQTQDFIEVSAELAIAYMVVVILLSVTYAHRMIGPTVAFRRMVEAMKNGDYAARVTLRKGDAFSELADDLNELASILERDDAKRDASGAPSDDL
jgi:methyl-accepting chemotaxis protein